MLDFFGRKLVKKVEETAVKKEGNRIFMCLSVYNSCQIINV